MIGTGEPAVDEALRVLSNEDVDALNVLDGEEALSVLAREEALKVLERVELLNVSVEEFSLSESLIIVC